MKMARDLKHWKCQKVVNKIKNSLKQKKTLFWSLFSAGAMYQFTVIKRLNTCRICY